MPTILIKRFLPLFWFCINICKFLLVVFTVGYITSAKSSTILHIKVQLEQTRHVKNLFQRKSPVPQQLYGAVVAQARKAVFFTYFGFEDTPIGRFDILSLHMFLLSRRLVREDTQLANSLNQEVFDTYTTDLDVALRALGVGDPSVPKRKKKMVRSFYGQVEDFAKALDGKDKKQLAKAAEERFFSDQKNKKKLAGQIADYMINAAEHLDDHSTDNLLKGKLDWPLVEQDAV